MDIKERLIEKANGLVEKPSQKSMLIVFIALSILSFLQLFLFKRDLTETNITLAIVLSLGMSLAWVVANFLSTALMFLSLFIKADKIPEEEESSGIVLNGILVSIIMLSLTYWSYEFNKSFNWFIKASIVTIIIYTIVWFIVFLIRLKPLRREIEKAVKEKH